MDELELEDDQSYEVEKMLRWRWSGPSGKRRKKEFLVLWVGYSIDDASWIPGSNFDYPQELQKMIDHANPIEETTMIWFQGRN